MESNHNYPVSIFQKTNFESGYAIMGEEISKQNYFLPTSPIFAFAFACGFSLLDCIGKTFLVDNCQKAWQNQV